MLKNGGLLNLGLQEGKSEEITIPEPFAPHLNLDINVLSFDEIEKLLDETGFTIIKHFIENAQNNEELNFNKLCIIAKKI